MTTLNRRARADLILNKTLTPDREVELRDGTAAGVGDTIITRQNNRNLRTLAGRDWVRNGDIWTIAAVGDDGTITIARDYGTGTVVRDDGTIRTRRRGHRFGGSIVLPASYVAEHVDLGYAVTACRAQGITTDTAHVLVEPTSTRETFYVAMTRGRHANHAYLVDARGQFLCAWRAEVVAPDLRVHRAQPDYCAVVLSEPKRFDCSEPGQDASCHRVVGFDEHRQHHPRGAFVSRDITQAGRHRFLSALVTDEVGRALPTDRQLGTAATSHRSLCPR
ncbi:hypothetical protein BN11_4970007 [Nostocoides australiense Ben110]|uniref:TrwC relaxase domain-containing protein n=1 Tax=Nostocoides australiense Ben110 TaxID=1193182 RepID=W6K0E7_9MICO|nr:hypothetical protein BN11_4970007 [Tetrasphaera australiensis Ben110]